MTPAPSPPPKSEGTEAEGQIPPWACCGSAKPHFQPRCPEALPQARQAGSSSKGTHRTTSLGPEGSRPEGATGPAGPPPLAEGSRHLHFPGHREVCLREKTKQMRKSKGKASPPPVGGSGWRVRSSGSGTSCCTLGPRRLRDVPLPRRPVHVPHDALHHPLDALTHPFAVETAGVRWGLPGPWGRVRTSLTP